MSHDKLFDPSKGEKPPEIMACLIHPRVKAYKVYEVRLVDQPLEGVRYGLCIPCNQKLNQKKKDFLLYLDKMLGLRLDNLKRQMDEKAKREAQDGSGL
jgi:hypothetical protein